MEYCFKISNPDKVKFDAEELKKFVTKLYIGTEEPKFKKDEKLPFFVITGDNNTICIKMTSVAKKNVTRIEEINNSLTLSKLKWKNNISLSKPFLYEVKVEQWWKDDFKKGGKKWTSLIQKGPYFTHIMQPYKFLGASLKYEGKDYKLSPREEKVASFYAKRIISEKGGGVIEELTKDKVFNTNFWNDFKKYLSNDHKRIFKDFNKIGWNNIVKKIEEEKERGLTDEEKIAKKISNAEKERIYGYAILDGNKEKLANYTVEPAGIFMGRGKQPNRGKIKKEVEPEDVILNIGKKDPKPSAPKGHKWGGFVTDQDGTWIAKWKDSITGDMKYVRFAAQGKFKGQSDLEKYEKARKLEKHIESVRVKYMADALSSNIVKKQLGTVLWLIDHHGIRVGGEKGDDEADTVGASTLRVEHVKLEAPDLIIFDFLGKDSIRFHKEIKAPTSIYNNFVELTKGKKGSSQVFNAISSTGINDYLKELDGSFTAKVFRTRLASSIMFHALKEVKIPNGASKQLIKTLFNKANAKVAEILNHTRTVSKKAQESVKKDEEKLKEAKKELKIKKKEGKSTVAVEKKIENAKLRIQQKTDVLAIAITTSLTNYIDPRLVIAWSKSQDVDLSAIYTKTLLTKFEWAVEMTNKDWNWETSPILIIGEDLNPTKTEGTGELTSREDTGEDTPVKVPTKVPTKVPVEKKGQGTVEDYKLLLKICEFPDVYKKQIFNVSKDAIKWIVPFAEYAISQGSTVKANKYIVKWNNVAYKSK
jgi:DNA topoisomerase-1